MKVNLQQDLHSPPHIPLPASVSSAGSGTSQCQTGSSCRSPRSGNGSIQHREFINGQKIFATMSSDEFKNGQKNNPPRLRGGKCYFKCSYLTIIFSLGLQIGFIHNTTVSGSTSYSQASILASTIIPISQA